VNIAMVEVCGRTPTSRACMGGFLVCVTGLAGLAAQLFNKEMDGNTKPGMAGRQDQAGHGGAGRGGEGR
jgi:hypothetical protein